MKRFSALAFRQHKSGKYGDLAFLQTSDPPIRNSPAPSRPTPLGTGHTGAAASSGFTGPMASTKPPTKPPTKPMATTKAMKLLMSAVLRRQYARAEALFARVPRLSERAGAVRLLVKLYCEQHDFVTARAVLFQGAEPAGLVKTGDAGVARFVAHLTFAARNAALINEAFQRTREFHAAHGTAMRPELATTVLNGLLFLGERELFAANWRSLPRDVQKQALESQVLRLVLDEDWGEAEALWRELVEDQAVRGGATVWYTALRYFLTESGDAANVDRVLAVMDRVGLAVAPAISALLLRHLPPLLPGEARSAPQWMQYARARGWALDGRAAEQAVFAAWHGRLPPRQFAAVRRHHQRAAARTHAAARPGPAPDRPKLAMGDGFNPFWDEVRTARSDPEILGVLRAMLKRGMTVPYDLMVFSFESAVRLAPAHRVSHTIDELTTLIRQHDYPLHCAGIDLSIVELHARANRYDARVVRVLLAEYLAQYPLVNNNLSQLTRIGVILLNADEPRAALTVLDSARDNEAVPISHRTHDSASLQVMVTAKLRLNEPLAPLLESLLRSGIYLDQTFFRKVGQSLAQAGESADILKQLAHQNQQIIAQAKKEAEEVCT